MLSVHFGLKSQKKYLEAVRIIQLKLAVQEDCFDPEKVLLFLSKSAIVRSGRSFFKQCWVQDSVLTRELFARDNAHWNLLSEQELERISKIAKSIDTTYCDPSRRLKPVSFDRCILDIARVVSFACPPNAEQFLDFASLRMAAEFRNLVRPLMKSFFKI